MPNTDDFRSALRSQLREAELRGEPQLEINAGSLHRQVGGYPGPGNRMPSCCNAMYGEKAAGDKIMKRPPRGKGAGLTILYTLPRGRR